MDEYAIAREDGEWSPREGWLRKRGEDARGCAVGVDGGVVSHHLRDVREEETFPRILIAPPRTVDRPRVISSRDGVRDDSSHAFPTRASEEFRRVGANLDPFLRTHRQRARAEPRRRQSPSRGDAHRSSLPQRRPRRRSRASRARRRLRSPRAFPLRLHLRRRRRHRRLDPSRARHRRSFLLLRLHRRPPLAPLSRPSPLSRLSRLSRRVRQRPRRHRLRPRRLHHPTQRRQKHLVQRHRSRVVSERRDGARVDAFPRDDSSRAPLDARRANLSPVRRLIHRPTARAREGVSYEPQSIARARRRAPRRRHDAATRGWASCARAPLSDVERRARWRRRRCGRRRRRRRRWRRRCGRRRFARDGARARVA